MGGIYLIDSLKLPQLSRDYGPEISAFVSGTAIVDTEDDVFEFGVTGEIGAEVYLSEYLGCLLRSGATIDVENDWVLLSGVKFWGKALHCIKAVAV